MRAGKRMRLLKWRGAKIPFRISYIDQIRRTEQTMIVMTTLMEQIIVSIFFTPWKSFSLFFFLRKKFIRKNPTAINRKALPKPCIKATTTSQLILDPLNKLGISIGTAIKAEPTSPRREKRHIPAQPRKATKPVNSKPNPNLDSFISPCFIFIWFSINFFKLCNFCKIL